MTHLTPLELWPLACHYCPLVHHCLYAFITGTSAELLGKNLGLNANDTLSQKNRMKGPRTFFLNPCQPTLSPMPSKHWNWDGFGLPDVPQSFTSNKQCSPCLCFNFIHASCHSTLNIVLPGFLGKAQALLYVIYFTPLDHCVAPHQSLPSQQLQHWLVCTQDVVPLFCLQWDKDIRWEASQPITSWPRKPTFLSCNTYPFYYPWFSSDYLIFISVTLPFPKYYAD